VTYPGFSSNLSATKETGVMLYGSLGYSENNHFDYYNYLGFNDWFSYQVGMFNGTSDGTFPGLNPIGTGTGIIYLASEAFALNKSFEGRVFFNPFLAKKDSTFQHLGIGIGASTQRPNSQTYLPFILSIGQNVIFGYQNSNTFAVSSRSRIHPQLVWYFQRLGLFADWGQTVQNLTTDITTPTSKPNYVINQKNQASEIQMVFNLTGEAFTLDSLKPNRNFNLAERGAYGALQMVLRFSTLNIDGSTYGAYRVLANKAVIYNISDPRVSISKATAWGIGFNWIWNPSLMMTSEFAQTKYIGGCSSGAFLDPINPGCLTASENYIRAPGSVMTNRPDEYVATETVKLLF
jgi:phosphate-selective porin OprO/OprP